MPALEEVLSRFHQWYPPSTSLDWDAVGLVWGDPAQPVRRIMLAVDPVLPVAHEAASWGADLLLVHHPLFLRPVHGFPATTPKGRTLAALVSAGCALLTAHTNADQAGDGVSEALAHRLGLSDLSPLVPAGAAPMDVLVVYVPASDAERLREVLAAAGAGAIGAYDRCSFTSAGDGRFRPLEGSDPAIGRHGETEVVAEERIEVVLAPGSRARVVRAMREAHPYEEPAYHVLQAQDPGLSSTGLGRVGTVEEMSLGSFARLVAERLPVTASGVRVAGDPDRPVRRVAVLGGAGDSLLDRVAGEDVDVYLTSDLRHHPASEFVEREGPALVDVPHWAAEWTWLPVLERKLQGQWGDTVETRVSTLCTDPWTLRV